MSSSSPTAVTDSDKALRDFTLWMLAALGGECRCEDGKVFVTGLPESWRTKIAGNEPMEPKFSGSAPPQTEYAVTIGLPTMRTLVNALKTTQIIGRAVPVHQPESVRDVSQRLFDEYTVEGGSVHLGGCTLEDRAILRVTCLERPQGSDEAMRLKHQFFSLTGEPIEATLVERLGLKQLAPPTRPIRIAEDQCDRWQQIGVTALKRLESADSFEILLTTVVWCKYAEGKLEFVIGEATTSIAFSGWAQLFVDGSLKPPGLACRSLPQDSHHLAATDDGAIVPLEDIATCSGSGQRVLAVELERCEATGTNALPEFMVTCPVSGVRLLRKGLAACETCEQLVSPTACEAGQCRACRSLAKVSKDDPRMARLLGEYPKLDRWSRWRLAETATSYVLKAGSLTKRLLIVVDKNSLEVLRLAKGSPFSRKWAEAPDVDRAAYLR